MLNRIENRIETLCQEDLNREDYNFFKSTQENFLVCNVQINHHGERIGREEERLFRKVAALHNLLLLAATGQTYTPHSSFCVSLKESGTNTSTALGHWLSTSISRNSKLYKERSRIYVGLIPAGGGHSKQDEIK